MQILKLTSANERRAIAVLKKGGVIAHPTETVWGLAADASNPAAVKKIRAIKKLAADKPLLQNLPNKSWLDRIGKKLCRAHQLAREFWPGPLALVVATRDGGNVGVRLPQHKLSNRLARALGRPLVTTSANQSGQPPARSATEVVEIFQQQKIQPNLILDDGSRDSGKPSTIVDVSTAETKILRVGVVSSKLIWQALAHPSSNRVRSNPRK